MHVSISTHHAITKRKEKQQVDGPDKRHKDRQRKTERRRVMRGTRDTLLKALCRFEKTV